MAKVASVLKRCAKLIFYIRKYEENLKDKVESKELTDNTLRKMILERRKVLGNYEHQESGQK